MAVRNTPKKQKDEKYMYICCYAHLRIYFSRTDFTSHNNVAHRMSIYIHRFFTRSLLSSSLSRVYETNYDILGRRTRTLNSEFIKKEEESKEEEKSV